MARWYDCAPCLCVQSSSLLVNFNKWYREGGPLMYDICQFPWCKYRPPTIIHLNLPMWCQLACKNPQNFAIKSHKSVWVGSRTSLNIELWWQSKIMLMLEGGPCSEHRGPQLYRSMASQQDSVPGQWMSSKPIPGWRYSTQMRTILCLKILCFCVRGRYTKKNPLRGLTWTWSINQSTVQVHLPCPRHDVVVNLASRTFFKVLTSQKQSWHPSWKMKYSMGKYKHSLRNDKYTKPENGCSIRETIWVYFTHSFIPSTSHFLACNAPQLPAETNTGKPLLCAVWQFNVQTRRGTRDLWNSSWKEQVRLH